MAKQPRTELVPPRELVYLNDNGVPHLAVAQVAACHLHQRHADVVGMRVAGSPHKSHVADPHLPAVLAGREVAHTLDLV